jgi:hypothetical protein
MITQCWFDLGCSISTGLELLIDGIHQQAADVGAERVINLANAGRAGDVDFRQVLADHVETDEQQAFFAQGRADLCGDPAIFFGQRSGFATAAGSEVATGFTGGGNPRQESTGSPSIIKMRLSPSTIAGR